MQLSKIVDSAANFMASIPPGSVATAASAAIAFLLSLVLLNDVLEGAAAGSQMLVTSVGGLIAAFLASRLAAYLMRVIALRANWPEQSRTRQLAVALIVAVAAAAFVLTIMVLVS
jgi:uncharacterized membrane protein